MIQVTNFKYLNKFCYQRGEDTNSVYEFITIKKESLDMPYFRSFKRLYNIDNIESYYDGENFMLLELSLIITKQKQRHRNGVKVNIVGFNTLEEINEYCSKTTYFRQSFIMNRNLDKSKYRNWLPIRI